MPFTEDPSVVSERVFFAGRSYRRYPNSPHRHLREYYTRSGGNRFLHQDIWEHHHGAIPEGHHIHHKDGNSQNNDLENLCCIPRAQHWEEHAEERRAHGLSAENLEHLAQCREKAVEWHKSDEGRSWHRSVSAPFLDRARIQLAAKREYQRNNPVTCTCEECGASFSSSSGRAILCSSACASRKSRRNRRARKSV